MLAWIEIVVAALVLAVGVVGVTVLWLAQP